MKGWRGNDEATSISVRPTIRPICLQHPLRLEGLLGYGATAILALYLVRTGTFSLAFFPELRTGRWLQCREPIYGVASRLVESHVYSSLQLRTTSLSARSMGHSGTRRNCRGGGSSVAGSSGTAAADCEAAIVSRY